ncbi:addiction module protein [Longimicrobium sp.]|uniref:addiction module protein n=1 Tax=Longimicrobium sp. TaxID=2029185 RepID=UPI002E34B204|nr:addiction module protein [Longimicrobium sp.]HEX6042312.1 addiction module protein [Longimicrobium sp.]
MSIDEIEAVALELPREELDELIDRLAAHRDMHPGLEQEWLDEVRHRVARYDAGEVEGIPMEETLAKLRAMLW